MSVSTPATTGLSERPEQATARHPWNEAWPLKRPEGVQLLVAYASVVALWSMIGRAYTAWFALNAVTRFDDRVARWLVANRTAFWNDAATWCSYLADTYYKIGVSVLIFVAFLWAWRRWYEAVYIGLPLVFEASAFIVITHLVRRDRPDVEQLTASEVATSFPSGHVAAATVYAAIAIVAFKHSRATWARTVAVVLAVLVPAVVAWARIYQGVHYLTDALAGIALGAMSLAISDRVLTRHEPDDLRAPSERPHRRAVSA